MRNGTLLVLFVDELIITVTLFLFSMSSSFMVTTSFFFKFFQTMVCICGQLLSCVQLFVTSWTLACQLMEFSSVYGLFPARILDWIAFYYSRVSSWPRDWTCISYIGRQILYHCTTWVLNLSFLLNSTWDVSCKLQISCIYFLNIFVVQFLIYFL